MSIHSQTKNIMANAIKNFAKDNSLDTKEVQFLISTDDNNSCTPKYQFLIKHKPQRQVSFNEILNVKVDFLGREMIASPFIANTVRRLSKENECSTLDVNVLIYAKNSNVDDVLMYVFNKNKGVKFIDFEYLFEGM